MSSRLDPLTIFQYLPQTNCKDCGEATCLAFAAKLLNRDLKLEDCPHMLNPENRGKYEQLHERLLPPVREVLVGLGPKQVRLGGEEVLMRHQLSYFNPTVIAVDVADTLNPDALKERVTKISSLSIERIGKTITLDMVAIRSASGDPITFANAVKITKSYTDLPLMLCSYDPTVLAAGLAEISTDRPLLYAATRNNWKEVAQLALDNNVPLVVSAPGELDELVSLAGTLFDAGLIDLVLDPGTFYGKGFLGGLTLKNLVQLRQKAILDQDKTVGFPLMAIPLQAFRGEKDLIQAAMLESLTTDLFIAQYADLVVLHGLEIWELLPILAFRQAIYSDPRVHASVDPGIREFFNPGPESPVLVTTNFALTYYTVEADILKFKVPCRLLVTDTEGLGVEAGVAGGQLTAEKIKELMDEVKIEEKVSPENHTIIIPGLAARLSGELEILSNWQVIVGPRDSADMQKVLPTD
ncbi:MAG: acetyl-CoA decarbonylase/synthase complex subunit gamma [Candidatus Heimdallarchaeota archaeon]